MNVRSPSAQRSGLVRWPWVSTTPQQGRRPFHLCRGHFCLFVLIARYSFLGLAHALLVRSNTTQPSVLTYEDSVSHCRPHRVYRVGEMSSRHIACWR